MLVSRITVHPLYINLKRNQPKSEPEAHDIAIMTLEKDLTFTDTIAPICLPEPATKDVGFRIDTAGWGVVRSVLNKIFFKKKLGSLD